MADVYKDLVTFHLSCVGFTLIMLVIYLAFTQYKRDDFSYIKRIRLMLPLFYMSLACLVLSGLVLWSFGGFKTDFATFFMIVTWIVILITSIKLFKEFKRARRLREYGFYKLYASFVLGVSILLILIQSFSLLRG